MIVYADTSALAALVIEHPRSAPLVEWLSKCDANLVACDLLETEMRRLAVREGLGQSAITKVLDGISLAPLDRTVFRNAGMLPFRYLRSLDSLHLEAALMLNADALLTYDHRLGQAASELGLEVISP